jgi:uncharacterized membrane protein YfcA
MPDIDPTLLLSIAVIFFAALTHGLAGFGAALVAMPLLVQWMDIREATPLVALLTLTINAVFLAGLRKSLVPGRIIVLLAGALFGVPVGILFLRLGDPRLLEIILGGVLVLYALQAFIAKRGPQGIGRRGGVLLGALSGFLGGAMNIAGPPAVVYTASQGWTKEEMHVTLQFYFIVAGIMIASGHALSGLTTAATLRMYGVLLPACLAGCGAGYALHKRISRDVYRRLVYLLLLVLGILLLWR